MSFIDDAIKQRVNIDRDYNCQTIDDNLSTVNVLACVVKKVFLTLILSFCREKYNGKLQYFEFINPYKTKSKERVS